MAAFVVFAVATLMFLPNAKAGTIVADSGFRVIPNGFSFNNYGDEKGYAGLGAIELQRIFGDGVCVVGKGKECVLTAGARYWRDDVNSASAGGHCYGMAMLASIGQRNQLPRFGIGSIAALGGGPDIYDLEIEGNRALQRAITRAYAMQYVDSVVRGGIKGSPNQILDRLQRELTPGNPATWQLGIFQWGMQGGHAVTPYAVEDAGDGIYKVHVYDNNWSGDDGRRLTIDTNRNTWKYFAATNPEQEGAWYVGNAKSESLMMDPNLPAFGPQECPICVGRQGSRSKFNQISLAGDSFETANVVITDQKGRRLGIIGGRLVNQIPGAHAQMRTSGPVAAVSGKLKNLGDSIDPVYLVPRSLRLKIRVNGHSLTRSVKQSLTMVGPTFDSTVEGIRLRPGQVAHATLDPAKRKLAFTAPKRSRHPATAFGAESGSAMYNIRVNRPGARSGDTVFFTKKPRHGMLRIGSTASRKQAFAVRINRVSARGQESFVRRYSIRGRQQAYLYYGPLARKNGVARIVIAVPGKEDRAKILKLRPN